MGFLGIILEPVFIVQMGDARLKQLGRYEILEEIGRGGFAIVYKAHDIRLDRVVALKVLRSSYSEDPQFMRRFRREAEIAAKFRHPNIVTVYDVVEIDQKLFIAMDYLPGQNLRQWLDRKGRPLTISEALPILQPLASALDYAHQQGVIHRDIKPANIMINETADGIEVVLTDFGLGKALEESLALTEAGAVLGSIEYMAPEQLDPNRRNEIGNRTDLYAFGIVAYQMLAGQVPFTGNLLSVLNAHLNHQVPSPLKFNPILPKWVAPALLRMLAKQPKNRFPTAKAFIDHLQSEKISKSAKKTGSWNYWLIGGVVTFLLIGVLVLGFLIFSGNGGFKEVIGNSTPTPGHIELVIVEGNLTLTPTPTSQPTRTPSSTPTPAPLITTTPTQFSDSPVPPLNPTLGSTWVRPSDNMSMVYVPAGTFLMGSDPENDPDVNDDQQPQHEVVLSGFWIDQYEVNNNQFSIFIESSGHTTHAELEGAGWAFTGNAWELIDGANWRHPTGPGSDLNGYENYPVVQVSWSDANTYCNWAEGQLPTEAQWEYAARGNDGRVFPWGSEFDNNLSNYCDRNCELESKDDNFNDGFVRLAPVGSYPNGVSWVNAFDMAGNVWERVIDWYSEDYYQFSPTLNPMGPQAGQYKVVRGGSWFDPIETLFSFYRGNVLPNNSNNNIGFRCVINDS